MKKSILLSFGMLLLIIGVGYYLFVFTNFFDKNNLYVSYYDNIKGLQVSSPVFLKGVKIGYVQNVALTKNHKVQTTFAIKKEITLPNGTIARITADGLNGSKFIVLFLGNENGFSKSGDELIPGFDSTIMENFATKVTPMIHHLKELSKSADSGLINFNEIILGTFGKESESGINSFNSKIEKINHSSIDAKMQVDKIVPTIYKLNNTLNTTNQKSETLNQSINHFENSISKLNNSPIKKNLEDLQSSSKKLSETLKKIHQNKTLFDQKVYEKTHDSLASFHQSLIEYQKDPPPLINILGSEKKGK